MQNPRNTRHRHVRMPAMRAARAASALLLAAALGACATGAASDSPGASASLNQAQSGGPAAGN